jgi:hypothetical protein
MDGMIANLGGRCDPPQISTVHLDLQLLPASAWNESISADEAKSTERPGAPLTFRQVDRSRHAGRRGGTAEEPNSMLVIEWRGGCRQ